MIPGGLTPKGFTLISHRLKTPDSLLQMNNQMGLAFHGPKNKVADLQAVSLKMGAPLCSLLEWDDHLSHNTLLGNINGQVPENGLGGQGDHRPKRG
jgi:hypothetical protein